MRRTVTRSENPSGEKATTAFLFLFFGIWFVVGSVLTFALLFALPGWAKLAALFPMIFAVIGAGGLWYAIFRRNRSPERQMALHATPAGGEAVDSELPVPKLKTFMGRDLPVRLSLDYGSQGSPASLLFINLFWNGIVAVVVGVGLFTDQFPGFAWLFLSPFILIGVFMFFALIQRVLISVRIPVTVIEVSDEPVCPGETVRMKLTQEGSFHLDSLQVELICEEKISYTRGTDTHREERRTWSEVISTARDVSVEGGRPWRASVEFSIPTDAMHSFQAAHNEVEWRFIVKGQVTKWPDFEYNYPFRVMPSGIRELMSWNRQSLSV